MASETLPKYDAVPYPSVALPESDPQHLRASAMLLGIDAPPVEKARVLELGCGSGGNIIPMACAYPDATFVGIDLSQRQIEDGCDIVRQVKAKNISLEHKSITDITPDWGRFDYIICHGVYSWVPASVQQHILKVLRENLSPGGMSFVSFNTYPTWHVRALARDVMLFHTQQMTDPQQRVREGTEFLRMLAQSPVVAGKLFSSVFEAEYHQVANKHVAYVMHEYLEDNNRPFYFEHFVSQIMSAGLTYVADAVVPFPPRQLPPDLFEFVQKNSAGNIMRAEQYSDFFFVRAFRRALLTTGSIKVSWDAVTQNIQRMHLSSPMGCNVNDIAQVRSDEPMKFACTAGGIATGDARLKAALHLLQLHYPQTMAFDELCGRVSELLGHQAKQASALREALAPEIANLWTVGLLTAYVEPPACVRHAGDRPTAGRAARLLADRFTMLPNQRHVSVEVPEIARRAIPMLDGTRTRQELVKSVQQLDLVLEGLGQQGFLMA